MPSFKDAFLSLGHRGASAYAPENTMAAFRKAYEMGADGVEFDVQLSRDGHVVIIHDHRVDRTTDGVGAVTGKSLEELKQLDAGGWFSTDFQGERIPTLQELLEFAKDRMLLNVELKKTRHPEALVQAVKTLVEKYEMYRQCLFTSFDRRTVETAMALMPDALHGLLIDKKGSIAWKGAWRFVAVKWDIIDDKLIDAAQMNEKKLVAWTVNEAQEMLHLLRRGVGRIITNYPDRAKKVIEDKNILTKKDKNAIL